MPIIQNAINVVCNYKNPIEILLLPQSQTRASYSLEIIFSMKGLKTMNHSLIEINKNIMKELQHLKLDAQFMSLQHPLGSN